MIVIRIVLAALMAASLTEASASLVRAGIGKLAKKVGAIPKCSGACKVAGPQSTIINNINVNGGGKVDARAILGHAATADHQHGYSFEGGHSNAQVDVGPNGSGHVSSLQHYGGGGGGGQAHNVQGHFGHQAGYAPATHNAGHSAGHMGQEYTRPRFEGHAEGHGSGGHDVSASVASGGQQEGRLSHDELVYSGGQHMANVGYQDAHYGGQEYANSGHQHFEGHAEGHRAHDVSGAELAVVDNYGGGAEHFGAQFDGLVQTGELVRANYGGQHYEGAHHEYANSGQQYFEGHAEGQGGAGQDVSASVASQGASEQRQNYQDAGYMGQGYQDGYDQYAYQYNQLNSRNEYAPQISRDQWYRMSAYDRQAYKDQLHLASQRRSKSHLLKALGRHGGGHRAYQQNDYCPGCVNSCSGDNCGLRRAARRMNRALNHHA